MNREIKFRGRAKANGKWIYGNLCRQGLDTRILPIDAGDTYDNYVVDSETVGQFTGVYDRMNHPIYEGDVMEFFFTDFKALVVYDNFRGFFCLAYEDSKKYSSPLNEETVCGTQFEIIGNIHDNPELINKDKEIW